VPIVTAQTIDCIAGLDALAEGSVPVVVTSPPYNIGIKYSKHIDRRADYLDWMFSVFTAVYRALAPDGHLFLQVGGIATSPNIPSQVLERAEKAGFILQNEIIWVKNISIDNESYGHFKPLNSARFLNHTHEFIYHLTKTGDVPVNRLAVGVPFKDKANVGRFSHPQDLRCRGNTWFIPYETIRRRRKLNDHPAIFPVELPTMCIQLSGVPRGSLIVDPFVGSGSTLVACKRLGMRGLGFDIDAGYVENANQRLTMSTPHGDEKDPPVVALANATQSAARRLSRNARRGQGRLTREGSAEEGNPTDCTTSNSMRIVNTTATTPPAVRTIDSGSIPILSPLRLLDDQGPAPDELRDAYPLHESTDSRDTVSATSQSQAQPPFTSAWQSGEPCPDQRAANALPKPVAVRNTRRTYLRYPGGKSKALSKMVPFFPNMFTQYREPMVGGGSAFLYIRQHFPHVRCWINDLDYGVYCFWKMAQERNAELVDELLRIKKSTEGDLGKQFFNDIPAMMAGADKFWTAVGFYYRNKCSFSGLTWQGTFCANPWVKNFSESCIRSLRELETTLAGVVITNVDYTNLLTLTLRTTWARFISTVMGVPPTGNSTT
jgi:site-specific DNA-methyltransferase (adenine-specific)